MDPSHSSLNDKFKTFKLQSQCSDPFVNNIGFGYKCTLCDMLLNSLCQVRAHVMGMKHRKLLGSRSREHSEINPVVALDSSCQPHVTSVDLSLTKILKDPHILISGTGYRCTLCDLFLNSIEQAQGHLGGQKHHKLLLKNSYQSSESNNTKKSTSQLSSEGDFLNEFKFRNLEVKDVLSSLKIFDADDPIIFPA